ncbi:hypothetical protein IV203_029816 [Nitzschia inconspicua]|uniref:Uncharacterized protein n=1 Tax=Nitzschia inconspicua TaxID=303405 RepID=A0A9K3LU58_9STRA|nr:hypothetical protein IV203_029816 [Nitzschia inconspicua]
MAADTFDDPLPVAMYAPLVIFQLMFTFLSVFGSCVVIRIATPKLGSTYQRFLCILSTAIVINAVFLFLHPILVPNGDTDWSVGNDKTCSVMGFFWVFGALLVSFYHNALALYFYCSIRDNDDSSTTTCTENNGKKKPPKRRPKNPEDVIGATEMIVNAFCWIIPAVIAGAGAAMKSYSFDPKVDMCVLYQACDPEEEDNCFPLGYDSVNRYGTATSVTLGNTFHWILVASACISVLVMVKIKVQVRQATTKSRKKLQQQTREEMDLQAADEEQQIIQKLEAVSTQCVLYTLSYLNSYVWFIALIFIPANNVYLLYSFQLVAAILYPSLGIFNCIIYIRPRVQMLQIMYPQDPFVVVVRVAMSKAGDPDEIELVREIIYGSEYSGSLAQHQESDCEESRDSAIPSVVHFDPEQKPLSIKSLVSVPGEGDDENFNNESLLSPLGDPDGDGSVG